MLRIGHSRSFPGRLWPYQLYSDYGSGAGARGSRGHCWLLVFQDVCELLPRAHRRACGINVTISISTVDAHTTTTVTQAHNVCPYRIVAMPLSPTNVILDQHLLPTPDIFQHQKIVQIMETANAVGCCYGRPIMMQRLSGTRNS
jgi:hypothetical protein